MHKHQPGQSLSIGRPVPNTTVYILDENEEPVPIGAVGVMWVGGFGISKGYVKLPDQTNTRYKSDRFLRNRYVIDARDAPLTLNQASHVQYW